MYPSCYQHVLSSLLCAFNIKESVEASRPSSEENLNSSTAKNFKKTLRESGEKISGKNLPKKFRKKSSVNERVKQTDQKRKPREVAPSAGETYSNGRVVLTSLKDKLVRFKLTGPLSQAVLCDLLQPADVSVGAGTLNKYTEIEDVNLNTNKNLQTGGSVDDFYPSAADSAVVCKVSEDGQVYLSTGGQCKGVNMSTVTTQELVTINKDEYQQETDLSIQTLVGTEGISKDLELGYKIQFYTNTLIQKIILIQVKKILFLVALQSNFTLVLHKLK